MLTAKNGTSRSSATGTAEAKPAADERPRLQSDWLFSARGHTIRVRFTDGSQVGGTLVGSDQYCLALALPGAQDAVLVFKHAVAALSRVTTPEQKNPTS